MSVRRWSRFALPAFAAGVVVLCSALPASADPGDLDHAFNGTGSIIEDFGGSANSIGQAVLVLPGNQVVAVGDTTHPGHPDSDFGIAKYLGSGEPDTSFGGGDGRVVTDFDGGFETVGDVLRQADGKLIVVGRTCHADDTDVCDFAVVRYRPNGNRDLLFGDQGRATVSFPGYERARAYEADFGPNGTIVIGGEGHTASQGDYDALFARLKRNGTLDASFSGDGRAHLDPSDGGDDAAAGVQMQSDGKLVAAGWSYVGSEGRWCVMRLRPNGTPDPTFSGDGVFVKNVAPNRDDYANDVLLMPTGKILAVGQAQNYVGTDTQNDAVLVRLNPNGTLDTTFGNQGVRAKDFGGYEEINRIVRDPSGRLVATGRFGGGTDFGVLRYHSNGTLDTGFGDGGLAVVANRFHSVDLAIADHERPVVTGRSTNDSAPAMSVARFLS